MTRQVRNEATDARLLPAIEKSLHVRGPRQMHGTSPGVETGFSSWAWHWGLGLHPGAADLRKQVGGQCAFFPGDPHHPLVNGYLGSHS